MGSVRLPYGNQNPHMYYFGTSDCILLPTPPDNRIAAFMSPSLKFQFPDVGERLPVGPVLAKEKRRAQHEAFYALGGIL